MKKRHGIYKRTFGLLFAFVFLFSGVFGMNGAWTAVLLRASATDGITFTVPETIYLEPSVNGSTQPQFFLNVNPDGTVPQGYASQGVVYFADANATNVHITCDTAGIMLSTSSGTNTVTATVGGCLQSPMQPGSAQPITWTAAFTENGQTKQVQTYSMVYAPYPDPVGAIAAANARRGGTSVYAACSTLIYGVQTVTSSASSGLHLDSDIYGASTMDGTGRYIYPLPSHGTTPQPYAGGQPANALLRSADSPAQMTSSGGTAFGYASTANTEDVLVFGGTGRIVYDMSRVTKVGHIPYFFIHSFLNGAGSDGNFSDKAEDFSEKAYYFVSNSPAADTSAVYARTQYWAGSNKTQGVVSVPSPGAVGSITLNGGYQTLYSAVTRSWKVSAALTGADRAQATAAAACEFYGVNKSGLRALYLQELSKARQIGADTQAWNTYRNQMRSLAAYLGSPMSSGTFNTSPLTTAAAALAAGSCATLTIAPNGGTWSDNSTLPKTVSMAAGSTLTLPTNLSRDGYTLIGWMTADGSAVSDPYIFGTADETITAQWEANAYTVVYNGNGATGGVTLSTTHTVGVPQALRANGFTREYTVYCDYNWSAPASYNAVLTAVSAFDGWNTSPDGAGTAFADGATVLDLIHTAGGTLHLYAQWTNSSVHLPAPARNGYVFGGWYADAALTTRVGSAGELYTPTANITLHAQWTAKAYTIVYDGNGATGGSTAASAHVFDTPQTLNENGFSRAFTVTYRHNSEDETDTTDTAAAAFDGWNTLPDGSGDAFAGSASVLNLTAAAGNTVHLYAQWSDSSVILPSPMRTGYAFDGWYEDEACTMRAGSAADMFTPQADCTLYAKWRAASVTITLEPDGGAYPDGSTSVCTFTATVGNAVSLPTNLAKAGYIFGGWQTENGVPVSNPYTVGTQNETLMPRWTRRILTLTIDPNGGAWPDGGTQVQTHSGGIGDSVVLSVTPAITGYTFDGWQPDAGATGTFDSSTNLFVFGTTNDTLTAQWAANTYTVAYDGNGDTGGGTADSTHIYDTAAPLTANGFSRVFTITFDPNDADAAFTTDTAAASFDGWNTSPDGSGTAFADEETVLNLTETDGDVITLYAQWTDGSITLPSPMRTGYAFDGWYEDAAFASPAGRGGETYTPAESCTLTAQWTANTYTIAYDGNGDTGGSTADSAHVYDTAAPLNANGFERAFTVTYDPNYADAAVTTDTAEASFGGWNTSPDGSGTAFADEETVLNLTETDGDTVTLYAQWTDGSITLPAPARTGYAFKGWYADAACTDRIGTGGAQYTPTEDCTLYAKWQKCGMLKLKYYTSPGGRLITPGSIVKVTVEICDNPGLISLMLNVHYNTTDLELIHVDDLQLFGTGYVGNPIFTDGNLSVEPYKCLWSDDYATANHTETGDLADFYFRVRTTAQTGLSSIWLSYDEDNTLDVNLNGVSLTTQGLDIPISALAGDVNGDGVLNAADAWLLLNYLNTPSAYPIAGINADIDGDGDTDADDVWLLQQMIAG